MMAEIHQAIATAEASRLKNAQRKRMKTKCPSHLLALALRGHLRGKSNNKIRTLPLEHDYKPVSMVRVR